MDPMRVAANLEHDVAYGVIRAKAGQQFERRFGLEWAGPADAPPDETVPTR
ncbi:MAG: hypothetical protein ACYCX5_04555 [Coriobacteriia bacterium]